MKENIQELIDKLEKEIERLQNCIEIDKKVNTQTSLKNIYISSIAIEVTKVIILELQSILSTSSVEEEGVKAWAMKTPTQGLKGLAIASNPKSYTNNPDWGKLESMGCKVVPVLIKEIKE